MQLLGLRLELSLSYPAVGYTIELMQQQHTTQNTNSNIAIACKSCCRIFNLQNFVTRRKCPHYARLRTCFGKARRQFLAVNLKCPSKLQHDLQRCNSPRLTYSCLNFCSTNLLDVTNVTVCNKVHTVV